MKALSIKREEWKDIPLYEGLYQVSSLGEIRSFPRNGTINAVRVLKGGIDNGGYKVINLSKNGASKTNTIHRLVAKTFIPNPKNLPEVNHLNGVRDDNRVDNLEWCDASNNKLHSLYILGNYPKKESHSHMMKPVIKLDGDGNTISEYPSIREASRANNINIGNLNSHLLGNRKSAGGFIWKLKQI